MCREYWWPNPAIDFQLKSWIIAATPQRERERETKVQSLHTFSWVYPKMPLNKNQSLLLRVSLLRNKYSAKNGIRIIAIQRASQSSPHSAVGCNISSVLIVYLWGANRFPNNGTCITCGRSSENKKASKNGHNHHRSSFNNTFRYMNYFSDSGFGHLLHVHSIRVKTPRAALKEPPQTTKQLQVNKRMKWQKKFNSIHIRTWRMRVCVFIKGGQSCRSAEAAASGAEKKITRRRRKYWLDIFCCCVYFLPRPPLLGILLLHLLWLWSFSCPLLFSLLLNSSKKPWTRRRLHIKTAVHDMHWISQSWDGEEESTSSRFGAKTDTRRCDATKDCDLIFPWMQYELCLWGSKTILYLNPRPCGKLLAAASADASFGPGKEHEHKGAEMEGESERKERRDDESWWKRSRAPQPTSQQEEEEAVADLF